MSTDRNAPYFELSYARALSRKLRAVSQTNGVERPPERPGFTRFTRGHDGRSSAAFDAAALGASLRGVEDAWGASAWHALLDGCVHAGSGSGAFAVDAQGLVIAARGDLDEALAARLGGRLMLTLEQAEKLGQESGVVCIELDGRWLTGLRGRSKSGQNVTVGVIAEEPIARNARTVITELLGTIGV